MKYKLKVLIITLIIFCINSSYSLAQDNAKTIKRIKINQDSTIIIKGKIKPEDRISLKNHSIIDSNQPITIYEQYKKQLDEGDTVKLKALSVLYGGSGGVSYNLYQIIKKNNSFLLVNVITLPYMVKLSDLKNENNYSSYPLSEDNSELDKILKKKVVPPIDSFEYTPYSIEVPFELINLHNFNIQNISGAMGIISYRKDVKGNLLEYTNTPYYEEYNFIEMYEWYENVPKSEWHPDNIPLGLSNVTPTERAIAQHLEHNASFSWRGNIFENRYRYGSNPTFRLSNIWAFYVTPHLIAVIENIDEVFFDDGSSTLDIYRRMAKSIKPINSDIINLQDLDSYSIVK